MPDFTIASAMPLIMSSLTLQANLFHEFQPMGGVRARFAEMEDFSCASMPERKRETQNKAATTRLIFMQTLYQNHKEIGRSESQARRSDLQCPLALIES